MGIDKNINKAFTCNGGKKGLLFLFPPVLQTIGIYPPDKQLQTYNTITVPTHTLSK